MRPLELAQRYMDIVFHSDDMSELRSILTPDLEFYGPLYQFQNANQYIDVMLAAPPRDFSYQMIKTYEDETSAVLVYQFSKQKLTTTMCQMFEVDGDRINKIHLIFDTAVFNSSLDQ